MKFFKENRDYFQYNGGDMETLFHFTKIAHARRVFCLSREDKKKIIKKDLDRALELFTSDDEIKKRKNDNFPSIQHMMYM